MHKIPFTFTCPLPPATGKAPPPPPPPLFTVFRVNTNPSTENRAQTQARYRVRNLETECAKARLVCNICDRIIALFVCYKVHVEHHLGVVYNDPSDAEFEAVFNEFRFKGSLPFNRDDTVFLLTHAKPQTTNTPPSSTEIEDCLAQLNRCSLVLDFSWDDEEAVAGYWKLRASPQVHDDNNIEFMFRHAVPAPMFENMDACGCT
ncbi:hypothetical protein B0H13DRAFT_2301801 [Mycena leptocephala]|nr:hypothetical protein B0H13DRAFT_2301801 [Mycena leptocephala]